jgi:hypothetical protein
MLRPVISYVLTSLILLSQVGVPLHMHYCKGKLESISVLLPAKCDDKDIPVNLPECCKKLLANHCTKKQTKKCCDDEVMILKQNITSIAPSFVKWIDLTPEVVTYSPKELNLVKGSFPVMVEGNTSDSGPPIYILHQALIFYANWIHDFGYLYWVIRLFKI